MIQHSDWLGNMLTLPACNVQDPHGTSHWMELSCLLPGDIMGQEAGKPRAVWLIPSSAISGGGLLNLFFGSSQLEMDHDNWLPKYGHFKFSDHDVPQK